MGIYLSMEENLKIMLKHEDQGVRSYKESSGLELHEESGSHDFIMAGRIARVCMRKLVIRLICH